MEDEINKLKLDAIKNPALRDIQIGGSNSILGPGIRINKFNVDNQSEESRILQIEADEREEANMRLMRKYSTLNVKKSEKSKFKLS